MKKLTAVINQYGWNYHDLLKENCNKTDWSEAETKIRGAFLSACDSRTHKTCLFT
ncbi:MAG: hypothetical protein WC340_16190 [Kiritimatiellia bacterium]